MFAKRFTDSSREGSERNAANEDKSAISAALAERDAAIARLERALADERAQLAALHESLEQARFKAEILERSYSTQLADARKRGAAAEQALADLQTRMADFETGREEQAKLLTESHGALERMTADRDHLLALLEPAGGPQTIARERGAAAGHQALSIDEMLAGFEPLRERPLANGDGHLPAEAEQEPPLEELLPPELMLAGKPKT